MPDPTRVVTPATLSHMAGSRSGFYDDALVYDVLHTPGTAEEVLGLEAIERRFVPAATLARGRRWLEPACGTGRYLHAAMRRGTDVVGFDRLGGMVEFASQRAPDDGPGVGSGEFFLGEMTEFAGRIGVRSVTLAFNLINTIRHLPDDGAMRAHFGEVSRVLAPGGVYVVGLSLTAYGNEAPSEDVWSGRRGSLGVRQVVQFIPPRTEGNRHTRTEHVISHLMIERPGGTEHRDSTYRLRTYSLAQWRDILAQSAMRVVATVDEEGEDAEASDGGYALFVLQSARV